jgi:hypothetical protein
LRPKIKARSSRLEPGGLAPDQESEQKNTRGFLNSGF